MSGKLTILGSGSSGGVPRLGPHWGCCDPNNPKNRRRRCAALVERISGRDRTRVLIDTPPDIREQLLDAEVATIDGVLFTHDHADHTHGIDDLRMLAYNAKRRVDVHFDAATRASMFTRFGYCFEAPAGSMYAPILNGHLIKPPAPVRINGGSGPIDAIPVVQAHGDAESLGFRFGDIAYSPDISGLPEYSQGQLRGLDLWIVDALRHVPHPSHFTVEQALDWIAILKPKRAILTHLHIDLDYEKLRRALPAHVEPAYDGMTVHFDWPSA
jgi:phosphoribosyl 1,2-cyclic phosphate phosphodiesterase